MRKLTLITAAAGTALAFAAAPASAQYAPQYQPQYQPQYRPVPQGYAGQYASQGYGYNNYGSVRALQARVDQIQGHLDRLVQRRIITRNEYVSLHRDSHRIEQRLRAVASYGLGQRERFDIERRMARLEQRIAYEVRDGRGWNRSGDYHGSNGYYGQSGYNYDRDRDGRDDRWEDDHD